MPEYTYMATIVFCSSIVRALLRGHVGSIIGTKGTDEDNTVTSLQGVISRLLISKIGLEGQRSLSSESRKQSPKLVSQSIRCFVRLLANSKPHSTYTLSYEWSCSSNVKLV